MIKNKHKRDVNDLLDNLVYTSLILAISSIIVLGVGIMIEKNPYLEILKTPFSEKIMDGQTGQTSIILPLLQLQLQLQLQRSGLYGQWTYPLSIGGRGVEER